MARWMVLVVGMAYVAIAVTFIYEKKYGMALVFGSYALSNLGLYLVA